MKLLLDTHILLWFVQGARSLPAKARRLIDDAEQVFVSPVSLWEASVKQAIGKLKVDVDQLHRQTIEVGFVELPISWAHAVAVRELPDHHRDPFDRMLIAQALHEPLVLLTHDETLGGYSPTIIVV